VKSTPYLCLSLSLSCSLSFSPSFLSFGISSRHLLLQWNVLSLFSVLSGFEKRFYRAIHVLKRLLRDATYLLSLSFPTFTNTDTHSLSLTHTFLLPSQILTSNCKDSLLLSLPSQYLIHIFLFTSLSLSLTHTHTHLFRPSSIPPLFSLSHVWVVIANLVFFFICATHSSCCPSTLLTLTFSLSRTHTHTLPLTPMSISLSLAHTHFLSLLCLSLPHTLSLTPMSPSYVSLSHTHTLSHSHVSLSHTHTLSLTHMSLSLSLRRIFIFSGVAATFFSSVSVIDLSRPRCCSLLFRISMPK